MDDDGERDGAKPVLMDPGAVAGRLGCDTVATIYKEEDGKKKERRKERQVRIIIATNSRKAD